MYINRPKGSKQEKFIVRVHTHPALTSTAGVHFYQENHHRTFNQSTNMSFHHTRSMLGIIKFLNVKQKKAKSYCEGVIQGNQKSYVSKKMFQRGHLSKSSKIFPFFVK